MDEATFYSWLLRGWLTLAALAFVALLAVQAAMHGPAGDRRSAPPSAGC